jgi:hypothetical protein
VNYFSVDNAGNIEKDQAAAIDIDLGTPTTTASLSPAADSYGWNNSTVKVTLYASDSSGPGVAKTYYSVDIPDCTEGSSWTCLAYSAPFSITAPGQHTVRFFSIDDSNEFETQKSVAVNIDETAPVTTASLSGTVSGSGYTGTVTVKLSATDNLSGVASTVYQVNGAATKTYTGPFGVDGTGTVTINFHSIDKAENVEATKSISFITSPATPTLSTPLNGSTWDAGTTYNTLTWSAVSGATSYPVQAYTGSCGGTLFATGNAVGNTSFTIALLSSAQTYYWRVAASAGGVSSAYSGCFSFKN